LSSSSFFSGTTANRYALALYELAKEKNELSKTEAEVKSMISLIKSNPEFNNLVTSPAVGKNDQINVLKKISERLNFSSTFKKFLGLVASKRRLFFLSNILNNFINLISLNKGELKAKLISSKELNQKEIEKIQNELSTSFGSKLNLNYINDPSLLGGFIVQIGSTMVDTSIKNKLKQYKQLMIKE